jgi:beta-ribofuranosylaminobenzene 5'-phosphate synthase
MLRIRTGSRLHFGLFNLGDRPRQFGGVGLMLDEPGIQMCATPAREWSAEGPLSARVLEFARRLSLNNALGTERDPLHPHHFLIGRAAPEHVGLGTGTQLALATARLLAQGRGPGSANLLARYVGRGLRSALGVHGFERGGFLVEAGKRSADTLLPSLSPLVVHQPFPDEWRVVVTIPAHAPGLHGDAEREAFAQLAVGPAGEPPADVLCRLTLLGMLPALVQRDVKAFGEALYEFNRRVGELFAPVQGGVYSNPLVEEVVTFLRGEGVAGAGQSSWGPAVFAIVGDADEANARAARLQQRFPAFPSVFVARAMNRGAELTTG